MDKTDFQRWREVIRRGNAANDYPETHIAAVEMLAWIEANAPRCFTVQECDEICDMISDARGEYAANVEPWKGIRDYQSQVDQADRYIARLSAIVEANPLPVDN